MGDSAATQKKAEHLQYLAEAGIGSARALFTRPASRAGPEAQLLLTPARSLQKC